MAQLGLNLGYLLVQIVCFFIIFVVVRAWIVKPLQGLLEKRRKTIAQSLEDARLLRKHVPMLKKTQPELLRKHR